MAYQPGLLPCDPAARQDDEVRYGLNVETRSKVRIFFRIYLQYNGLSRHISSGAGNFRSSRPARPAPLCPEIHKHRNRDILDDFIEELVVYRKRFGDGSQGRFTGAATRSPGEIPGWNPVLPSAIFAGTNDRYRTPPSTIESFAIE
jgi:hypothetical protein